MNIKDTLFCFLKGIVFSLIFMLISVLIFAFIIEVFSLDFNVIKPVNYVLKSLAVVLGVTAGVKGDKMLIKGLILGVLIYFISVLAFGLIAGSLSFDLSNIWEVLLSLVIGGLSAFLKAYFTNK